MQASPYIAALALCCAAAQATDTGQLAVSAVVLSRSSCIINGPATLTLAFGTIDPASTADATASVITSIRCNGSAPLATFSIVAGNGLSPLGAGNRRMRHLADAAEFLPYALTITPASATIVKSATQLITISGSITPTQFRDARSGAYSDTVAITLTP